MRGNINSCYRMTTLTFLRRNLLACRQEVINSFRLFRVPKSGLQIIKYFSSQRHKLQRLEAGLLYGLACFKIFHDTLKSVLVSFNCQMCLLSSVLCFLLGVEKEALWFANLVLKKSFQLGLRRFGRVCRRWLIPSLGKLQTVSGSHHSWDNQLAFYSCNFLSPRSSCLTLICCGHQCCV